LWCHKSWSNGYRLCPQCSARLDPEDGVDGAPEYRPATQEPFTRTSTFVLRRLSVGGSIVFQGHEGRIEANVVPERGEDDRAPLVASGAGRARLTCVDLDGDDLFSLETYDAADKAFTARSPDGAPMATYLSQGTLLEPELLVRDGTSAPVATLRPKPGGLETFTLVETGGDRLAVCWREDLVLGQAIDERWCVSLYDDAPPLPRLAIVALPLVCLILFGRPARAIPQEDRDPSEELPGLFGVLDLFS
jgi:hypothetical protein